MDIQVYLIYVSQYKIYIYRKYIYPIVSVSLENLDWDSIQWNLLSHEKEWCT